MRKIKKMLSVTGWLTNEKIKKCLGNVLMNDDLISLLFDPSKSSMKKI